jgi:tetratricopeptide (TPR) repeat protein
VCPKDALYVGFGVPAIVAQVRPPPAHALKSRVAQREAAPAAGRASGLAHWALLAVFVLCTYVVLLAYNGEVGAYVNPPEWGLIGVMTALSLLVVLVFRGKARRTAEYSLTEEALLGLAFLFAMLAFRGLHGSVPLLFGFGLSALFAWASVQAGRLLWRGDARIQRIVLKREGRFRPAGFVFAAAMVIAFSGFALALREQAGLRSGGNAAMVRLLIDEGLKSLQHDDAPEALRIFERALQFDPGSVDARRGLAGALCQVGRSDEGIVEFEKALAADPGNAETHAYFAAALLARKDVTRALPHVREAVRLAPERGDLHLFLADVLDEMGQTSEAAAERARAQALPGGLPH